MRPGLPWQALKMMSSWPVLGLISMIVVLALRWSKRLPGAIALMLLGLGIVIWQGLWPDMVLSFSLPPLTTFDPKEIWRSMLLAGFSQIPLTVANSVIATAALIKRYWPDAKVAERQLSLNIGVMNLVSSFFGGMPMCHGAGGLAAKYYFGARTGGANIIEGIMEITAGLFLAGFIVQLIAVFPGAVVGTMLFLVGVELIGFLREASLGKDLIPMAAVVLVSLASNMAYGFMAGFVAHYLLYRFQKNLI